LTVSIGNQTISLFIDARLSGDVPLYAFRKTLYFLRKHSF